MERHGKRREMVKEHCICKTYEQFRSALDPKSTEFKQSFKTKSTAIELALDIKPMYEGDIVTFYECFNLSTSRQADRNGL